MPPTVLAKPLRFHQIEAQNPKPMRGRTVSETIRRGCPLRSRLKCQKADRLTPHEGEKGSEVQQLSRMLESIPV